MLRSVAAYRVRMLLAVVAGTVVVCRAVLAVFLVVDAMTAGAPVADGADWGPVY